MNTIVTTPWSAVIFDMDGVVTDTASLHAIAWKRLFDDVLASPEAVSYTHLTLPTILLV